MHAENAVLAAFSCALSLGFWCEVRCRRRMMPGARKLRGGFRPNYGRREDFTPEGWRYRNLMIASQVLAVCLGMVFWLSM